MDKSNTANPQKPNGSSRNTDKDFDEIHAWYANCLCGPSEETLVFTDRFDELEEMVLSEFPWPLGTSYTAFEFYRNGKHVGSIHSTRADWNKIKKLASGVIYGED